MKCENLLYYTFGHLKRRLEMTTGEVNLINVSIFIVGVGNRLIVCKYGESLANCEMNQNCKNDNIIRLKIKKIDKIKKSNTNKTFNM